MIGKFIDSSGLPKLMVDSGMLAEGSVRGFLNGTHFNRCKKLHPVVALSLKILHFKSFLNFYEKDVTAEQMQVDEIVEILQKDSIDHNTVDFTIPILEDILKSYNKYTEETLNGKHGCTAQFALTYVELVELYHQLERSIRTSDVSLYKYVINEVGALFFAFNHQNYSRWSVRNHNQLMNIESSHPGLLKEFESGVLSIRRTSKNFCRSPIDLTLEQTVTGISSFTNNFEARQRWSETHTARMAIISHFFENLELTKFKEADDTEHRRKIFTKQMDKFTEQVCGNLNPFDELINRNELFNLSTGKAATPDTADFLLNIKSVGAKQRDKFIEECAVDSSRFDRPIKRNALKNFAIENQKHKKCLAKKNYDSSVERNVFGHILCCAIEKNVDLLSVFSYPLTTVPHSLANTDGTMVTNCQKGELTSLLMSKSNDVGERTTGERIKVEIIDGFYYLNTLRNSPTKYGQFADFLLKHLCATAAFEIHLIFDRDEDSSIKDLDIKKKAHENSIPFKIIGPNQERNGSLSKFLTNPKFRDELVNFLVDHWAHDENIGSILGKKKIIPLVRTSMLFIQ